MDKLPPLQKVYEAWGALAGGRVSMGERFAEVTSSNGQRRYTVVWEGDAYRSNDSATYWQGYAGYPVLAVLMAQGRLPYDRELAVPLAGVDWNLLNSRHRRDYEAAATEAFDSLGIPRQQRQEMRDAARATLGALAALPISVGRNGRPAR